jgi:hypothetical protein
MSDIKQFTTTELKLELKRREEADVETNLRQKAEEILTKKPLYFTYCVGGDERSTDYEITFHYEPTILSDTVTFSSSGKRRRFKETYFSNLKIEQEYWGDRNP